MSETLTPGAHASETTEPTGSANPASKQLLAGIAVVDLTGSTAAAAGRILADLGAIVTRVLPSGRELITRNAAAAAWNRNKRVLTADNGDDPALLALLARADVVIEAPNEPGAWAIDPSRAPNAAWVRVTPFGGTGPRAAWRASDLGVMAASGNMFCTGFPDRAPLRASEPAGDAHVGPEVAFAALSALASGRPQLVDVAMHEIVMVANMAAPGQFPTSGARGVRRGAAIGRTREIWPTTDGFVSFGVRGGKARVASLEMITELARGDGIDADALESIDWASWSHTAAPDDELAAIQQPIAEYFARHTTQELYDIACERNLMLAPINSPKEILSSKQLAARNFFATNHDNIAVPNSIATVTLGPPATARPVHHHAVIAGDRGVENSSPPAWAGVNILEFGSGAAGPIATRFFAEHGATVLRVESRTRPDFLRIYALGPDNPHGLEGSTLYDGLNVNKRDVTLNLKHPEAVELVVRLVVEWADAVCENFAPRAMRGFGLDYGSLAARKPDLVMASACLNGQTGPHRDYPGFGGQGSALAGYNWVTGWPDREPVGPYGTITDSLAPRFVATALAAALLHRRATGVGAYLDLSQVETAIYTLTPWLIEYQRDGVPGMRIGNRHPDAVPHGAFPCADEGEIADRWVAIAIWNDAEWTTLSTLIGLDDPSLATAAARRDRVDEVETQLGAWTSSRTRSEIAEQLQALGIEAVPVQDFGDIHEDPQVLRREHFVALEHPFMGPGLYERNGFRFSDAESRYVRSGPTLGQDNDWVLGTVLGLDADEQTRLRSIGAVE